MNPSITYNLIITIEGQEPCHYELQARRIGIGRGLENHIRVDCPAVSTAHSELHRTRRGYELEDLLSSNGTVVNGFGIQKCVLQDGDRILIGGQVVAHYLILPAGEDPEQSMTRSGIADETVQRYLNLRQRLEALDTQIREREERLRDLENSDVKLHN